MGTPHIVYLHGLNCTRRIFTHLHSCLPDHEATFIDYPSAAPLETSYNRILHQLPKTRDLQERGPVSIIGHSLGGILATLIALRLEDYPIESVISISTPFAGTATAAHLKWIYPSYAVFKDIGPGNKAIKEVTSKVPKGIRFTSIISTDGHVPFISGHNDGVVSIKSQEATRAAEVLKIHSSHFEIMQDPDMIKAVKRIVFP